MGLPMRNATTIYENSEGFGSVDLPPRPNSLGLAATRLLDIVVSFLSILFLLPLLTLVAIAVFASDPGPIIFRQMRLGHRGRYFPCYKFRTMVQDADARLAELLLNDADARAQWERDHKLKNDPRIIGIGRFLRKSSIDELPQFFNVLKGEMSLVGPRPIVEKESSRYGRYISHYCSVKPGITGLWQISGRNDTTYRRRVALDVAYSRSKSLKLDIMILANTIPSVLLAKGSY
jgi:lipopolysaccharide/colanic/teichoic acid biosynthesis glycosyltransferase